MKNYIMVICLLFVIGCNDDDSKVNKEVVMPLEKNEQEQIKNDTISLYERYLIPQNNAFKSISLPFSSKEYIDANGEDDDIYPFYRPSDILINYFISIDYEGEEYKCYILPQKNKDLILLTWIPRGDSEYYLLILLNSEKIITYKEIGKGGEDIVYFIIKEDFSIDTYNDDGYLKKFLIKNNDIVFLE